jgi:ADP-ribose pyrophosphatase YjhB (NUDIX family)
MVAFDKGKTRFNIRVAGVAVHEGRVLLVRNSRNQYWVLPGGHPEMMEPLADALAREMLEESGQEVEVVRMLWVLENFFHKKKDIHEISFYFLVDLPPGSPLLLSTGPFYGMEHENTLTFRWFPIDQALLRGLPLCPGFLSEALTNLPDTPQHVVFHDMENSASQRLTIS